MYSKSKFIAVFVFVAVILAAMVPVGVQGQEPQVTSETTPARQQQAALDFWTRERFESTEAFPMPVDYGSPSVDQGAASLDWASSLLPAGNSPAGKAEPGTAKIAKAGYPEDWVNTPFEPTVASQVTADTYSPEPYGSKSKYDQYLINNWYWAWRIYPHRQVGRFSFVTNSGTSYCSATAISNNNIVTAAHCVYDTTNNYWYWSKVFTPAYRNGSAPWGSFATTGCTILTAWVNLSGSFSINGWTKYDLAVCSVGNNGLGQSLNSVVGWAGRSWNYGYNEHRFNLGYPWRNYKNQTLSWAGKYLVNCSAETFYQTVDTLGMGCYYGPGISGGPWFRNYKQVAVSSYVNSVNSGLYVGQPNLYGIRFTSSNIVPLCNARGC
jgi:V8-like Glu-specific endopeptidase